MDYRAFRLVNGLAGHEADGLFIVLATDLAAVMIVLVALVFLVRWRQHRQERRSGALLGTVSAAVALLVSQPISHAVERMRPYPGDVLAGALIGAALPATLFAVPATRGLLERVAEGAGELWDRVRVRLPVRAA